MTKMSKGVCQEKQFALSMIHLWVYELVPHMETIFQMANICRCNIQIKKCFIYNGQCSKSRVSYGVIRHIDYRATVEPLNCREFNR